MRASSGRSAILLLLASVLPAAATDLSKIERTIPKEPALRTAAPTYCLLVFGPQAKTRVWLIHDGDVMHVQQVPHDNTPPAWRQVKSVSKDFLVGDVCEEDGKTVHKYLRVRPLTDEDDKITVLIEGKDVQIAGLDRRGQLQFAAKPKNAPIIHFNGPLTLDLFHVQRPLRSNAIVRVSAVVGTPGQGPGAFAQFTCDSYLGFGAPVADIVYPPKSPGGTPLIARVSLGRD